MLGSDTLEPGEGLLEGLQMLVALSFDNCSRRQNFPFLDPAQAVSSHHLSGVIVGIHHAPAAPFVAEFGPGLLEVSGRAAITNPRLAGALLLHPRVAGFLFFGRLLVLPFAVSFVLLAQVPAVDAGEGYVLASREALCLAAPLRYAPTTSRSNWNGAGRSGTMRGWGYPHLKLSRSPHSPRGLPALCLRQTTKRR